MCVCVCVCVCVCLPLDVASQVAVQDSRGGEEAGLWQGNHQLARLTEETGTDREKNILTLREKLLYYLITSGLQVFLACSVFVWRNIEI